jgi:hypothetical protein
MTSMEHMFRQFLDQFQNIQNNNPVISHTSTSPRQTPEQATNLEVANDQVCNDQDSRLHPLDEPPVPQVNPHINRIQQLLDAAEADAARFHTPRHNDEHRNDSEADAYIPEPGTDETHASDFHEGQGSDLIDGRGRCYADGFGELDVDSNGQLRYVGLGSTAGVAVENCIGLRRHISKGLEKRGYEAEETFFTTPEATHLEQAAEATSAQIAHLELPPPELVDVLVSIYAKDLAYLFPITSEYDVRRGYENLLSPGAWDPGHAAAFYALLAVATPLLSADNAIFSGIDKKWVSAGPLFYNQAMRFVNMPFNDKSKRKGRSSDMVIALGLLSMYLAETGSQAEAWISVGRAIRIAQDIGLHRSPERLRLPKDDWNRRRYIWWCLYILERQLCTGKSMATTLIVTLLMAW